MSQAMMGQPTPAGRQSPGRGPAGRYASRGWEPTPSRDRSV
jgi:hypothetical protein